MTSNPNRPAKNAAAQTLRFLVGAVVGALLLIGAAFSLILPFADAPLWTIVVVVVLAVGVVVMLMRLEGQLPAVPAGLSPEQARAAGLKAFQTSVMRRLLLSESVAFVGIVLGFVGRSIYPFYLGAIVSVVLIVVTVWPSRRNVERTVARLERDGARTGVREVLGYGAQDATG